MSQSPAPTRPAPRGVSMPTVVWGVVLGVVAATALVRELTGRTLDVELAGPPLLLVAGAVLVLWAVVGLVRQSSRRSAREAEAADHHDLPLSTPDDGSRGAGPDRDVRGGVTDTAPLPTRDAEGRPGL